MDNLKRYTQTIITIISVFTVVLISVLVTQQINQYRHRLRVADTVDSVNQKLKYYQEAERINDYYSRNDVTTRALVIRETLESIDQLLPRYFPNGPYTRNDFIAMAMVESGFDQYLVGTHKEFGIFQIMPEACKDAGVKRNQYDIRVNTELALTVLSWKYQEHPDYKTAMIAYNGIVYKSGKLSDTYWKKFIKARKVVDDILSDSYVPTH